MIYLAMAMYPEAALFIQALHLKRVETRNKFQLFVSDTHRLLLTGTGSLNAAIANTWMLTSYPPDPTQDVFAQIGCCAAISPSYGAEGRLPLGSLFLCHKLTDASTKRSHYPDMLYRSDFSEATLTTYATLWQGNLEQQTGGLSDIFLADMEGFSGFEAASLFFQTHRIFTWKIVSDYGYQKQSPAVFRTFLEQLFLPHVEPIVSWLSQIPAETDTVAATSQSALTASEEWLRSFSFSATQKQQLTKLLHYARLAGYQEKELLAALDLPNVIHPAQRKREGKRFLQRLEQLLLS